MEGKSPARKQAKFSWRILCSSRRILRCPMPNEHPVLIHHLGFSCGNPARLWPGGNSLLM